MFFDIYHESCTMPLNTQSLLTCEKDEIISTNLIFLCEYSGIYNRNVREDVISVKSKKISNDQELIQSDPTSCPQSRKGNK